MRCASSRTVTWRTPAAAPRDRAASVMYNVSTLITKARSGTLHDRRLAGRHVQQRAVADKLFQEVGPKFATRKGGYTRILKTGHRKGDGAEMARIELIPEG